MCVFRKVNHDSRGRTDVSDYECPVLTDYSRHHESCQREHHQTYLMTAFMAYISALRRSRIRALFAHFSVISAALVLPALST